MRSIGVMAVSATMSSVPDIDIEGSVVRAVSIFNGEPRSRGIFSPLYDLTWLSSFSLFFLTDSRSQEKGVAPSLNDRSSYLRIVGPTENAMFSNTRLDIGRFRNVTHYE